MEKSQHDIALIYSVVYKGKKNFMTPNVVRYGTAGDYFYELSKGDFMGKVLYGVTFLNRSDNSKSELNQGGISLDQAERLIQEVREGVE